MALMQISLDADAITAIADEAIYSGAFVKTNSGNDAVTSMGLSSYSAEDIKVMLCNAAGDNITCIGIAAEAKSSGSYTTVYTNGLFIARSSAAIGAGDPIAFANSTDYEEVASTTNSQLMIGRAISGASAGDKYLIIKLRT